MYQLLSFFIGVISSLMISVNGSLAGVYGTFIGAMIVHIVGSLLAFVLCWKKNIPSFWSKQPKWIYLGGAVGVFTTLFQSAAFGKISTTGIVTLNLAGQMLTSLAIDTFGLFGMPKRSFTKSSLISLIFSITGIVIMGKEIEASQFLPILFSIGSGVSIVISRTINARLSNQIGPLQASLVNHWVGLPITVLLAIFSIVSSGLPILNESALQPWIYLGGMMGVCSVLLLNIAVPKLAAFQLTTLSFTGQLFTGMVLDLLMGSFAIDNHFIGGMVIAVGVFAKELTKVYFKED